MAKDDTKVPMGDKMPEIKVSQVGDQKEKKNKYGANFEMCDADGGNTDTMLHRK